MTEQRLANAEGMDAEAISRAIQDGGRFIIYQYTIGLLFFSLRFPSRPTLVRNAAEHRRLADYYNNLNGLFGPWSIPYGPSLARRLSRSNSKAELDVTLDILRNLTPGSFEEGTIQMTEIDTLFMHLPKEEMRELNKALSDFQRSYRHPGKIYAGIYTNVEQYVEPPYMLGFEGEMELERWNDALLKSLYKRFYKHTYFQFFTESEDPELYRSLTRQGQIVVAG